MPLGVVNPLMARLWVIGLLLCGLMLLLGIGSHYQSADTVIYSALGTMVVLMVAGVVWFALLWAIPQALNTQGITNTAKNTKRVIGFIILVGFVLRLIMLPSDPILEIDYFRYLWDGIVVSNGLNPYAVSPYAAIDGTDVPSLWHVLAQNHKDIVESINYAPLRTIYPPVAQFFFWLAVVIPSNFDLLILRLVLILCEFVTVLFLISLLKHANQSPAWVALYWWNPLIIKELINSAHMDAILLPFLVGAVLLAARNRFYLSSVALVGAIGVKIWPILLAPLLLLKLPFKRLVIVAFLSLLLLALMAWPIIDGRLDRSSGFVAYAALWARNEAIFSLLENTLTWLLDLGGLDLLDPGRLARFVVALSVGSLALLLAFRSWQGPNALVHGVVLIAAALFLTSATGYPWYYAWILPFLVLVQLRSLMLLTVLLPFYYLRFYMVEIDQVYVFDTYIVWLEFGPVLLLLGWELLRKKPMQKLPA